MTAAVFKCQYNDRMDSYATAREARKASWRERCKEYSEALGGKELFGIAGFEGSFVVQGFLLDNVHAELPAGWRRKSGTATAVPAKRTPEGKVIVRELFELRLSPDAFPGVPEILHGENHFIFPRTEKINGQWWLTLSKIPDESDAQRIAADLWPPAKLSEYFAAKEAVG